jgi:hypothetical protein
LLGTVKALGVIALHFELHLNAPAGWSPPYNRSPTEIATRMETCVGLSNRRSMFADRQA